MDPLEFNDGYDIEYICDEMCRICLQPNVVLDWNDEIVLHSVTYKECYFKYTQLEMHDVDPFSQMLCENCSKDLRKSHFLMVKALESHAILQTHLNENQTVYIQNIERVSGESNDDNEDKKPISNFETNQYFQEKSKQISFNNRECNDQDNGVQFSINKFSTSSSSNEEIGNMSVLKKMKSLVDEQKRQVNIKRRSSNNTKWNNDTFEINSAQSSISIISASSPPSQEEIGNMSVLKKMKSLIEEQKRQVKIKQRSSYNTKWNDAFRVNILRSSINRYSTSSSSSQEEIGNMSALKKMKSIIEDQKQQVEIIKEKESQLSTETDSKDIPSLMCSICSRIFSNMRSLLRHEETHNEHRVRTETCPHCSIKFFNKSQLKLHLVTHNENREKYKCEFCEKAYFSIGSLNFHKRMHLGQMIPCPTCSKEFYRQEDLDRHNITVHSAAHIHTNLKKRSKYYVFCKDCNKQLRTTSWKAHQAAHLKEPLMKCSICAKEFFTRDTVTHHMHKVHSYRKREEYEPFIIYSNPKRLSHLLLEQQEILKPMTT